MADGWIKLNRSIQDHWLWKHEPYDKARAWIDLLMLANYEDKKVLYKGEIILCKKGDVNLSINYLAKRWKWDRKTVRKFIDALEKDEMVTSSVTKHRTTITIVNYGIYQDLGTTKGTTKRTSKSQQDGQPSPITKEMKKDNNILSNDNIGANRFAPPTFEEVQAYCTERNNRVDARRWFDFYSAKGWMVGKNKMKDWRAAVRTWEKGDGNGSTGNKDSGSGVYTSYKF